MTTIVMYQGSKFVADLRSRTHGTVRLIGRNGKGFWVSVDKIEALYPAEFEALA